jgi:hypothetical protein
MFGAMPHSNEPKVNSATQMRKTRMRPSDSLSLPASGMTAVCVSKYAVSVQPTQTSEVCKSDIMFGRATDTTVLSMENINKLTPARAKNKYAWRESAIHVGYDLAKREDAPDGH